MLLELLLSSSMTLDVPDWFSDDNVSEAVMVRPNFSDRCLCSSKEICSTGNASRIFSVAVGSRARMVKVQSSWFCWKRRRKLSNR